MLEGWGRFVHRRRWPVFAASLLLLAVSIALVLQGGRLEFTSTIPSTESGRASKLLDELRRPSATAAPGSSFTLVFRSDTLAVNDPAYRDAVAEALAPLRADERVTSVRSYYDAPSPQSSLLSRDGRSMIASVQLKDPRRVSETYFDELRALVRSDRLQILATGNVPINHDFDRLLERDLQRAEVVSLPIALVLLLVVFGTVVGALVPLGVGLLAIVGGIAGVYLLARVTDVSNYALNIVTLIGLGTSIDYSLFLVARFREELASGATREAALARSMATAGRAVLFSGLTVAIGLSGLLFFEGTFLSSLGLAGAIVVAIAVVYALTFLPAVLAILGPRVNAWRLPLPRSGRGGNGLWHSLATAVMRRPVLVLVPTVAFVLAAGSPFLQIRMANADPTALPPQAESRRGYDAILRDFPGQEQSTIPIVLYFPDGGPLRAGRDADVLAVSRAVAAVPDVLRVIAPFDESGRVNAETARTSTGEHIVLLTAISGRAASSDAARDLVRAIRALPDPPGGEMLVTGQTAFDLDTIDFIATHAVRMIAFIVGLTYIALFLLLGSVLLPLKAVLMNLLSITASFGAMVWVFVQGHLSDLMNFTPQSLDPTVPVILFCIVFGLSMDYEVLLLSRIQEEYRRTGDNTRAVAEGLERSGRLITAAAAIMVAVFTGFALADVVIIKSIGLGMAIAVALDATLVRALIVPAAMRLLGDLNWWAPAPIARAHRWLALARHGAG
ncbi:MAG TPA: MMPL family transporter [Candidatus Limnocylindria bacterium]|nr:MMPL family transporter [Candidatus Limnocylindria bacterium]